MPSALLAHAWPCWQVIRPATLTLTLTLTPTLTLTLNPTLTLTLTNAVTLVTLTLTPTLLPGEPHAGQGLSPHAG